MRAYARTSLTLLAVVSIVYSLHSIAGGADSPSSSSPCFPPTLGVDTFANVFPGLPELQGGNQTERRCKRLCRRWRLGCRGTVLDARDCFRGYGRRAKNLLTEECATFPNRPQGRPCKEGAQASFNDFANFTVFDTKAARVCCNTYTDACIDGCLSNGTGSVPPCSEFFN